VDRPVPTEVGNRIIAGIIGRGDDDRSNRDAVLEAIEDVLEDWSIRHTPQHFAGQAPRTHSRLHDCRHGRRQHQRRAAMGSPVGEYTGMTFASSERVL
jgi:hypothetical protein